MLRGVALASLSLVAACGGERPSAEIGNAYIATHYRGLAGVPGSHEVEWGPRQYDQLVQLDRSCEQDIRPHRPGMLGPVLKEGVLMALGNAIGVATGAVGAFGSAAKWSDYALYGAGAGAGSGIAGAVSREQIARRYAQGACMYLQTYWAQSLDKQLVGVGVIPWVGGTSSKKLERPTQSVGSPYPDGAANPAQAPQNPN
ncbi:MAG: hypothetical protein AAB472_01850 [Patescibacteria group bacterium]